MFEAVVGEATMHVHRLFSSDDGESHFADIDIELGAATIGGRFSAAIPATSLVFREVQATYALDWHPAPRRQFIVNLDNGVRVTASDGESRVIGAGEVLLVEDTWGKGHQSIAMNDRPRSCLFIAVG